MLDGAAGLSMQVVAALGECGYDLVIRSTPDRPLVLLQQLDPDLLLIDMSLANPSAFEVCGELRTTDPGRAIPILLVSGSANNDQEVARGLLCGADDFLNVRDRPSEFQARVRVQLRNKRERDRSQRLTKERDTYRHEAVVDVLTGIPNRRAIDQTLRTLFVSGKPFAALFIDVDHFKRINDSFGHEVGDAVLKAIAGRLKALAKGGDHCGRYGGEEFILLVEDADWDAASTRAEDLCRAIEEMALPFVERATVSVGVAVFDPQSPDVDVESLLGRADAALYEAKRMGRNRVATSMLPPPGSAIELSPGAFLPEGDPVTGIEAALLRQLATGRAGLPILPAAAATALSLAEDPKTNMSEIAKLVERDPPLAARFTAIAGSAAYSRSGSRVATVHAALVRVGLATARDLLLQCVYERSTGGLARYQSEVARSFDHSVRSALAARCIAKYTGITHERAYLCGLLHDIGESRIYRILSAFPEAMVPADTVERLVARHHGRAGVDVARAWNLPEDIVDTCMHHHGPIESASPQVRIVMAAERIVTTLESQPVEEGFGLPPLPEEDARLLEWVGVPTDRMNQLVEEIANQVGPGGK